MTDPTPWAPRLLRFRDRPAYLAALAAAGWPAPSDVPAETAALVELGVLHAPGTEDAPGPALPGWHVRALFAGAPPAALASAEVAEVAGAPVVPGLADDGEDPLGPVPASVTRRQLLLELAASGLITPEEALAAATSGAVPARMEPVFATLPEEAALAARITWASMGEALLSDPLVAALAAAEGLDGAAVAGLFRRAGAR